MLKKCLVAAASAALVMGPAAVAQADDIVRVVEETVTIPVASGGYPGRASAMASCPPGETRTGGGASVIAGNSHADRYLLHSTQPISGEAWWAFASNTDTTNPGTLKVYAICARVVSTPALTTPIKT
ncbi:hypothetical protein [Streptomyces sp. NBC_00094]|uniref:hypothetical protein n=1 Tax=Streptomyces sp. NBC_00094 TaxID=2903620 RepID=UPI002253599A|nr:hypothetical protein [Streptomyces sp. NBC_00094]MCX5395276.1 hypothetical protein [Streptomyces sp. NBC_00094]